MTTQTYEGSSNEELLTKIIKFWVIVKEYKMLPIDPQQPELEPH